jgi:hypothetical protein
MRASLLAILTFTAAQAFAQDVTIVPTLRAGDAFQLEVIETRQNSRQPKQNRVRSLVEVRVISAGTAGFVIDWVPGEPIFDNAHDARDPQFSVVAQALRDIRFRLNLNPDGEVTGLANRAEVAPKLKIVVDTVVQGLAAKLPGEKAKAFRDMVGQMLTVDTLIASATRDAETYFALNGVSLASGKAVTVDVKQPNPLGGDPIPARFEVRMDSATEDVASITTTTTYDPTSLRLLTESVLRKTGATITPEQMAKIPSVEMADQGRYVYDRKTRLMREVIVNRRVNAGPTRQVDGWVIKLIKAPH